MTIQYQLSEQEVLSGFLKKRRVPAWHVLMRGGVLVIGILFIAYSRYNPSIHSQTDFAVGYIFVFLGLILIIFTPVYRRTAYAKYVHDNAAIFTELYQVTFSDAGIAYASSKIKSEFAWSVFKKLLEDGQYFYFYGPNNQQFSMVPKRAFDVLSLEEFRRFSQSIPRA